MTPSLPDQDRADGMQRGLGALLHAGRRHNTTPFKPDGFVVYSLATDEPVAFIACTKSDPSRERVDSGLAMRVDFSRFYFGDTRYDKAAER